MELLLIVGLTLSSLEGSVNAEIIPEPVDNRLMQIENKFESLISKHNYEVEAMLKDHISLKTKFEQLDREHEALKNDMAILRQQNENLATQVYKLQNDSFQKHENAKCKCEKTFPTDDVLLDEKEHEFGGLIPEIDGRDGEMHIKSDSELQNDLPVKADRAATVDQRRSTPIIPPSSRVAFFARMSSTLTNPSDNQHIEFHSVMTNVGNAYNGATSTFICPVAGTYVFFASILSLSGKWIETVIARNNNELTVTYSLNQDNYDSGSNMAIIDLQKNDAVWVRVHSVFHDSGDVAASGHSTFAGFILWEN